MNLEKICKQTITACEKAAELIMSYHDQMKSEDVEEKGNQNFVTVVDKKAEVLLVKELNNILPEAGIIAEEGSGESNDEKYSWIIDPIDGTTNFIHGAFPFAISVCLAKEGKPVVGVVHELGLREVFYAWKGGGAYLNGRRISVSDRPDLKNSLIAFGFPYRAHDQMDSFLKLVRWFMENTNGLRRLGSAATDIAWVACGRFDGFFEYGLEAWDVAGGAIILEEAGGKCTDFDGGDNYLFGNEVICSNGYNHDEFLVTMKQFMN